MNEPDKEGFIMKQGHGRFAGFRQRYVKWYTGILAVVHWYAGDMFLIDMWH